MKNFIKKITSLLAVVTAFCLLSTLTACTTYSSELEGDWEIGYSEFKNDAFISEYMWRGHLGEDMDIVLPNTYNGAPVTTLGGYIGTGYPCPFTIDFFRESALRDELFGEDTSCDYFNSGMNITTQEEVDACVKDYLEKYDISELEIEDIVFNLRIGSNLQKIENVYDRPVKYFTYAKTEEDEVVTVYALSFEITVDEDNAYFYSDELGRMYYRENNRLVELFLYHNRDEFPQRSL